MVFNISYMVMFTSGIMYVVVVYNVWCSMRLKLMRLYWLMEKALVYETRDSMIH